MSVKDKFGYTRRSRIKKSIRRWIISILVFWGMFKILFYLLSDVIFQFIDIPKPYDFYIQLTASGIIILLSLIFTSMLVNERNSYEEQ
jgi:Na+-driven multidrug efflux pump